MRRSIKALVAGVAALALSGASVSLSSFAFADAGAPAIQSDQADYTPGSSVVLTGSSWTPGQTVHVAVDDSDNQSWHYDAYPLADESGAFETSFSLPEWFVANYTAIASDADGHRAVATFTDGNVQVRVLAGTNQVAGVSIAWSTFTNSDCTDSKNSGTASTSATAPVTTSGIGGNPTDPHSIRVSAPSTVVYGGSQYSFVNWTGDAPDETNPAICIPASVKNGVISEVANYGSPQPVGKTDQHLTFDPPSKTYGDADFSVAPYASSDSASGIPITFARISGPCTLSTATVHITGAGSCVIRASQAGNTSYNAAADVDGTIAIDKATPSCSVTGYAVPYDGSSHTATGSCTGVGGAALSGLDLSQTTHTAAGTYGSDAWSFTDGTGNYYNASGTVADSIGKVNPTCSVTGYSVNYDGNSHTATGSCTGVGGESLTGLDVSGTTHTNAGSWTDSWTFTSPSANYNNASGSVSDSIGKVNATCSVTGYSATYDGNAHVATGSCTGIGGAALTGLDLTGTSHTGAGSWTDSWSFTDVTGNYNDDSGTVSDSIAKANPTCSVTGYSVTYDGDAHTASGSCTGVNGESLSGLDLSGTTNTNAGSTLDGWTFTDVTGNYNDTSGSVTDVIAKADPTCSVTGYSVTYDGDAHTATGSCTGVKGESLSGLSVSGTTHTNAGTSATDGWSYTDATGNYNHDSGTVSDSIGKADPTCSVTGYTVTYDGDAHTASGSCTGVKGESLPGLSLSGTTHTNAGSYPTDAWSYTDSTGNYNNDGGTVADSIGKANPTCSVTGYSVTYDANAHTATGSCTGAKGETLAGLNLSGTTHTNAGSYPSDTWSFTDGTGNYNNDSGTVSDSIAKANPTCTITGYSVSYDGNFHTATGSCRGVSNELLSALDLTGTSHKDAGTYTDSWSFTASSSNYNDASGSVSDVINTVSATLLYTGTQYVAQGTSAVLSATVSSTVPACVSGQTLRFTLTPTFSGGTGLVTTAVTGSTGQASKSVATNALQTGVYEVAVSLLSANCIATDALDSLVVVGSGDTANGGGWYTLDSTSTGSGRVNFGFTVQKVPNTTNGYKGQLLLQNNGKWRFKAALDCTGCYGKSSTTPPVGAVTGSGKLYKWDATLNGGLGDWALVNSSAPFTINFTDASQGGGKKSSDAFSISIGYTTQSGDAPLPNSKLITLKGGDVKLT
jgi:hypothetical protein